LDALTARLGIIIPSEERHTAMGDTRATAEAYLRLSAALKAKGLERFEDVVAESSRYSRLIEDANHPGEVRFGATRITDADGGATERRPL
jgi:DNA polymerase-3 subunit epsilon